MLYLINVATKLAKHNEYCSVSLIAHDTEDIIKAINEATTFKYYLQNSAKKSEMLSDITKLSKMTIDEIHEKFVTYSFDGSNGKYSSVTDNNNIFETIYIESIACDSPKIINEFYTPGRIYN